MDEPTSQVKTIGRYQLLDEIGRGAMGVVYKAFDPAIGRTVALKTLTFDNAEEETEALRKRLHREASAAGTLAHQNIVTIYDIIDEGGTTAIAMEYIEGQTLASLIEARAPLPLDAALEIFEQVCAAIDFAGSQGIVHRDIKPANIMLTADNRVKVADFGVARIEASTMTQTGVVMGSPSYMSPEQVRGQTLDTRSDLFSAAVVLYELLTKERPFAGDDVATTMYRIVHEPPPVPSQFNVAIGDEVAAILNRGLAKEPAQRYHSGAQLCTELRHAVSGARIVLPDLPVEGAPPRRLSPLLVGGVGLGVVLLALVALVLVGGQPAETPAESSQAAGSTPETVDARQVAPAPVAGAPLAPMAPAVPSGEPAPSVAPPPSVPVTTIPPRSGTRTPGAAQPQVPSARPEAGADDARSVAAPEAREAAVQSEAPAPVEPERAPPAESPASLRVTFAGAPYAVTLMAGDERLGVVREPGGSVPVDPGGHLIRALGPELFFRENYGERTFEAGGRETLALPATASAFVGVLGDAYDGLQMTISGTKVPAPYPAQISRITVGRHAVGFRWTSGGLSGLEITDVINLRATGHYLIRAVPETSQITVQKLR